MPRAFAKTIGVSPHTLAVASRNRVQPRGAHSVRSRRSARELTDFESRGYLNGRGHGVECNTMTNSGLEAFVNHNERQGFRRC